MGLQDTPIPKIGTPATRRDWAICPNCGAKTVIYDNAAECRGVYLKCTRGCRAFEFELVVENGKQIIPKK